MVRVQPGSEYWTPKKQFGRNFFRNKKKPKNPLFVSTPVMVQCHVPPTSANGSSRYSNALKSVGGSAGQIRI